MKQIICQIYFDKTKEHVTREQKSKNGDQSIHYAEYFREHLCSFFSFHGKKKSQHATHQVNEIMPKINFKQPENRIVYKTQETHEHKYYPQGHDDFFSHTILF